jgi:hypothetical protein
MMDVGDIDQDGKQEIVVALASGFIDVLDAQARKVWAKELTSAPLLAKVVKEGAICVATEDGSIFFFDAKGNKRSAGKSDSRPVDMQILHSAGRSLVIITSVKGEVIAFETNKRLATAVH